MLQYKGILTPYMGTEDSAVFKKETSFQVQSGQNIEEARGGLQSVEIFKTLYKKAIIQLRLCESRKTAFSDLMT